MNSLNSILIKGNLTREGCNMTENSLKKMIRNILKHCEEKNCDCILNVEYYGCMLRMDDFPRGMFLPDFPEIFFSKSECEVIQVIKDEKPASLLTTKTGRYTKRHSLAIEKLKRKKIIGKNKNNILYITGF